MPCAARALLRYAWPGNVRELEKCLETALVLAGEKGKVGLEHLPEAVRSGMHPMPPEEARREELIRLLIKHRGNITKIALELGKARMQVQRELKRHHLDPAPFR